MKSKDSPKIEFQETLDVDMEELERMANEVPPQEVDSHVQENQKKIARARELETEQSQEFKVNHPVSKYLREVLDPKIPATPDQFMRMIWRTSLDILSRKDIEVINKKLQEFIEIIKYNSVVAYGHKSSVSDVIYDLLQEKLRELQGLVHTYQKSIEDHSTAPEILDSLSDQSLMTMNPEIRQKTFEALQEKIKESQEFVAEVTQKALDARGTTEYRAQFVEVAIEENRAERVGLNNALLRITNRLRKYAGNLPSKHPMMNDFYELIGNLEIRAFENIRINYHREKRKSQCKDEHKAFLASTKCVVSMILKALKKNRTQRHQMSEIQDDIFCDVRVREKYGFEGIDQAIQEYQDGDENAIKECVSEIVKTSLKEEQNPQNTKHRLKEFHSIIQTCSTKGGYKQEAVNELSKATVRVDHEIKKQDPRGLWFRKKLHALKRWGAGLHQKYVESGFSPLAWLREKGQQVLGWFNKQKWRFAGAVALVSVFTGAFSMHNSKQSEDFMKDLNKQGQEAAELPEVDQEPQEIAQNVQNENHESIESEPNPEPEPQDPPQQNPTPSAKSIPDSPTDLEPEPKPEPNPEPETSPQVTYTAASGDSYWTVGQKLFKDKVWDGEFKNEWRTAIMAAIIATHTSEELKQILRGEAQLDIRKVANQLGDKGRGLRTGDTFLADADDIRKLNSLFSKDRSYRKVYDLYQLEKDSLSVIPDPDPGSPHNLGSNPIASHIDNTWTQMDDALTSNSGESPQISAGEIIKRHLNPEYRIVQEQKEIQEKLQSIDISTPIPSWVDQEWENLLSA